jgi:hypothetical protein
MPEPQQRLCGLSLLSLHVGVEAIGPFAARVNGSRLPRRANPIFETTMFRGRRHLNVGQCAIMLAEAYAWLKFALDEL